MQQPQPYAMQPPAQPLTQPMLYQEPAKTDFQTRSSLVPGILMILSAVLNIGFVIYISVLVGRAVQYWDAIPIIVFYFIVGFLAILSSRPQRSKGPAIALIIFASLTLIVCLVQIAQFAIAATFLFSVSNVHSLAYFILAIIVSATICFFTCIALIVIASTVVCGCCGAPPSNQPGMIYQTTTVPTTYQAVAQVK